MWKLVGLTTSLILSLHANPIMHHVAAGWTRSTYMCCSRTTPTHLRKYFMLQHSRLHVPLTALCFSQMHMNIIWIAEINASTTHTHTHTGFCTTIYSRHTLPMWRQFSSRPSFPSLFVFPSFEAADEPQNGSINAETISTKSKENAPPRRVMTNSSLFASGAFFFFFFLFPVRFCSSQLKEVTEGWGVQ